MYDICWKYVVREWRLWTPYLGRSKNIYNFCTLNFFFKVWKFFFSHSSGVGVSYINITLMQVSSYIELVLRGVPRIYKR
jgi:hypothetical protein